MKNAEIPYGGVGLGFRKRPAINDLVAVSNFYPQSCIDSFFTVVWVADKAHAGTRNYPVALKRLCVPKNSLPNKMFECDAYLRGHVLGRGMSSRKITEYWWAVNNLVIRDGPDLARTFSDFLPVKV